MNAAYEEWLDYAQEDLKFGKFAFREEFYSQVCYLAQQTIEKTLKACLVKFGRVYPKTHNLKELGRKLPEIDLTKWTAPLATIDGYYVPLRYPDAAPGMKASGPPNKEEAQEALRVAEEIFSEISQRLLRSEI